jgi:hypothetical protein
MGVQCRTIMKLVLVFYIPCQSEHHPSNSLRPAENDTSKRPQIRIAMSEYLYQLCSRLSSFNDIETLALKCTAELFRCGNVRVCCQLRVRFRYLSEPHRIQGSDRPATNIFRAIVLELLGSFPLNRTIRVHAEYSDCRRRGDTETERLIEHISNMIQPGTLNANLLPLHGIFGAVFLCML